MPSDPTSREYRDSVGMFTTGITVVTATSERFGHGMTANAFASVSLDPLLVLVCVVKDAMMHKVLDEVGRFAVSVLAGDQEDLARYFSDSGGRPGWPSSCPWPGTRAGHRRPPAGRRPGLAGVRRRGGLRRRRPHGVPGPGPLGRRAPPAATRCCTSAAATAGWETRKERPRQRLKGATTVTQEVLP